MEGINAQGKLYGQVYGAFMHFLDIPLSHHLQVFINQEALQTPNFGDLWRVDHVDIVDHYLYFQPFSLLKRMGDRAEESKLQTMTWSFW